VDDDGRDVPEGTAGELILKAPSMCSGYFENPEATAEAIDAQGWFHTGDLARRDADGFYFIAGRKKDMFISGGENVYPLELETALHEHPAVQACAVVGVPDPKWGEVGRAYVVLKPGAQASPEALLEHLRGRVARYKVPKQVEQVTSLPISAAGKILKRELRERAIAQQARGAEGKS
jgi:fatty-acyl-CoA synthase